MSEQGRFASVAYNDKDTGILKYEYAYYSTHGDIYPNPNGAVYNGFPSEVAMVPEKDDVSFLSSYQDIEE